MAQTWYGSLQMNDHPMTDQPSKRPAISRVEMTELILPGDANTLGNAFGGKIMQWIDVAAGVASRRHCGGVAVTASMDSMQFVRPIRLGDVVVLRATVNRAWRSSMEVGVRVECETVGKLQPQHAASAYLTFVAMDEQGRPRPVPPLSPGTKDEQRRYDQAQLRREHRISNRIPKPAG